MLWSGVVTSIIRVRMYEREARRFWAICLAGTILAVNSVSAVCASVLAEEAARSAARCLAEAREMTEGQAGDPDQQKPGTIVVMPVWLALDREVRPVASTVRVGPDRAVASIGAATLVTQRLGARMVRPVEPSAVCDPGMRRGIVQRPHGPPSGQAI